MILQVYHTDTNTTALLSMYFAGWEQKHLQTDIEQNKNKKKKLQRTKKKKRRQKKIKFTGRTSSVNIQIDDGGGGGDDDMMLMN